MVLVSPWVLGRHGDINACGHVYILNAAAAGAVAVEGKDQNVATRSLVAVAAAVTGLVSPERHRFAWRGVASRIGRVIGGGNDNES